MKMYIPPKKIKHLSLRLSTLGYRPTETCKSVVNSVKGGRWYRAYGHVSKKYTTPYVCNHLKEGIHTYMG